MDAVTLAKAEGKVQRMRGQHVWVEQTVGR